MGAFWQFAARLRRHKAQLTVAMVLAAISAGGLGAGFVALAPVLEFLLKKHDSIGGWLHQNAPWVPQAFVDRLPTDPFGGVLAVFAGLMVMTAIGAAAKAGHAPAAVPRLMSVRTDSAMVPAPAMAIS
jgi:hypothetical protein